MGQTYKGHPERWPSTLPFSYFPLYQLLVATDTISPLAADTAPLTIPVISNTAGITWATTIRAQNPKNTVLFNFASL